MSQISIPEHGSPEQALAVYEFLQKLLTHVFE
jgi:hypothetical protein